MRGGHHWGRDFVCGGKELTLQRDRLCLDLLSLGTHFTEGVTVCGEGTHFTEGVTVCGGKELTLQRDRLCLLELTLKRELLSVGTHFTEGVTVCGNSLYRGSYCL